MQPQTIKIVFLMKQEENWVDVTLTTEESRIEKRTICTHETVCVSKRWILSASLSTSVSAKMLFHSPTDDRVSELQSVVNSALPITAFT